MRNRHVVVFLLLVALVALMALVGCGSNASPSDSDAASSTAAFEDVADVVSATGEVRPARWADLSYPVGGTITTVHVEEGEEVAAGQLLVELDAVPLTRAVAEAQAALLAAQADLARVKAGPRSQDVAAAEEALAAAEAPRQYTTSARRALVPEPGLCLWQPARRYPATWSRLPLPAARGLSAPRNPR